MSYKSEPNIQFSSAEGRQSPLPAVDDKNVLASTNLVIQHEHVQDSQNDTNYCTPVPTERNQSIQEFSAGTENHPLLQPGFAAERSRSQLKAYIGHKAEEMYVYRSLPLGQDRRRNRYWQFITSASRNDPGSGRIFVELRDGCWRLIDSEEVVFFFTRTCRFISRLLCHSLGVFLHLSVLPVTVIFFYRSYCWFSTPFSFW